MLWNCFIQLIGRSSLFFPRSNSGKDSTIQNSNLSVLPMAFDFIAFTMSSAVRAVMLVFFSIARQKWHLFAEPMASLEFLPSCDSK